jgi:putative FmdB family regulatory protein
MAIFPERDAEFTENRRRHAGFRRLSGDDMPTYEYEHLDDPCERGKTFEVRQSIDDPPLAVCPRCKGMVRKLISRVAISTPKSDSQLKDMGFTKLVRRDDGIYENVTRRDGESRYMLRDRPETVPDIKKIIRD